MRRHPLRQALRLPQAAFKRLVTGLLQLVLLANRPARLARSGFVLPTTVLLVLMVVLTATALTYRSFTRSDMAISQREQQVISNAATPAIDRAKAKIEFLFRSDPRFPAGVPASDILSDLMATKRGSNAFVGYTGRVSPLGSGPTQDPTSPYTLPDETRVDINNDGNLDNAWSFKADVNGDGTVGNDELVVYSILVDDQGPESATTRKVEDIVSRDKANALVTRTGALATTEATPACSGALAEAGWQLVTQGNSSSLQKNFQVNAFVANANAANRTFETLEFQQSRIASRASRWGAWFRYDLGVFPGAPFNWNGAMHTDGSFFANQDNFRAHMISSQNSCLYTKEASTITVGEVDLDGDDIGTPGKSVTVNGQTQKEFQGQIVRGSVFSNDYTTGTRPEIHYWNGPGVPPVMGEQLTEVANESTTHSVNTGSSNPFDIAMNPLKLFTNDVTEHIKPSTWSRNGDWDNVLFKSNDRTKNEIVTRPFVDDFFRADNRWGPKPRYDSKDPNLDVTSSSNSATIGDPITSATVSAKLTNSDDGLDGYWERQAVRRGLRLIVGERLELGNASGWGRDPRAASGTAPNPATEALYPAEGRPTAAANKFGLKHEYLQRRSLRDNLAAVQGMVVYHYEKDNGNFPAACMAMTAHPGTPQSIINSRTFTTYPNVGSLKADFLTGNGTNGWEFQFPSDTTTGFDTPDKFAAQIANDKPLGIALRNLAAFAGDPNGGAPSFKPVQDGNVHPAPFLSMWGDYSPLRRILAGYDAASGTATSKYASLSPADQATLHSAACTLGLLAYNVDRDLAELNSTIVNNNSQLQNVSQQLGKSVQTIMDCLEASSSNKSSACKSGNFTALAFLKTRGDINSSDVTVWSDPNTSTVITADNICPTTGSNKDAAGFQANCDAAEYFSKWGLSDWTAFINIPNVSNSLSNTERDQLIADLTAFAQRINTLYTTVRDRDLGFRRGISTKAGVSYNPSAGSYVNWDGTTGLIDPVTGFASGNTKRVFNIGCDPNIFQTLSAKGSGGRDNNIVLGLMACSELNKQPVKYPSLYYLFPLVNHDHDGTGYHQQPDGNVLPSATQAAEPYITDNYARSVNSTTGDPSTYRVVSSSPNAITGISVIAAVPKSATASSWTVPAAASSGALTTTNLDDTAQAFKINAPSSTVIKVPFLDKGMFDGREQLNTRVLDIDIEALTTNRLGTGDFWLPANKEKQAEGIVYAFREDAVREDEIVRPKNSATTATADECSTMTTVSGIDRFKLESDADCRMRFDGLALAQDPPLTADRVSLKPVDFIGDPQRRTHGFRLRTASGNPADFSGTSYGRGVGMTLVTDNAVYILGDFNPHSKNGTVAAAQLLEEFTQTLNDKTIAAAFDANGAGDDSFFYGGRTTLNLTEFANPAVDHWRPVEILADSLTVLSSNFKDGAVIDTFTKTEPGSSGGADSSYMNQNRPRNNYPTLANLIRENPADANSPVWIDRNGTYYIGSSSANQPFYSVYTGANDWMNFANNDTDRLKNTQTASAKTYINALFVAGIVPQRAGQTYGGLHNYPRMLEAWSGKDLFIAGSFIQLNFSTAAAGPFEHDAWEETGTNASPTAAYPDPAQQRIGYYNAPNRRWGYDVGLLYVPPAPAARRFVSIGAPRSEYYRELAADDPYIVNLRCAKAGGNRIMPNFCPDPA